VSTSVFSSAITLAFVSMAWTSISNTAQATGTPFCFGDGTGTHCPCANGAAGNGCPNSVFASGASLFATGVASDESGGGTDTLVLSASGVTGPGLFFQGSVQLGGGAGVIFGDGLRCTGSPTWRIGLASPTLGLASYPGPGNIPIHSTGGTVAGNTYHYQFWYRDSAAGFCTPSNYNFTNALTITWTG